MLNFDPNLKIPHLAGQQPPELCSKYFLYRISQIFVHIFAKNMKGWSGKSKILCIEQLGRAEKKLQNKKFPIQPFSVQIFPKYFSLNWIIKNICCCSIRPLTFSYPSSSLLELPLILVNIVMLLRWVSTCTKISNYETDFNYFCLKYINRQKMEAKVCFS